MTNRPRIAGRRRNAPLLVVAAFGIAAGTVHGASDAPRRDPVSSQPDTDQGLSDLLTRDPKLSEMVRRDPELIAVLRQHPELVRRLAVEPPVRARIIRALTSAWVLFGFGAQFMFMMRFVIQWVASERRGRSYVPVVFWWFSLAGGIMLFTYAVHRRDPVFILGQGLGCLIYVRNLVLIRRRTNAYRQTVAERADPPSAVTDSAVRVAPGAPVSTR